MGISAIAPPSALADEGAIARIRSLGFDLNEIAEQDQEPGSDVGHALRLAAERGTVAVVVARDDATRNVVADRLADAAASVAATATDAPLALVVLPALSPPLPGPVAVVTPAETVSAYEVYVGAAVAAATHRRVVHLNGRGTPASAVHSGVAGRVLARSAAPEWREFAHARPERSLHTLTSRPGAVVAAVPPGSTAAARLVADHPDADVVLVVDRAHARHGATVAAQVAAMIELAFSLGAPNAAPPDESGSAGVTEADAAPPPAPISATPADPAADLPGIRASDVVHVRLTADALELTNRTAQRLRLRVALGSATAPDRVSAVFACELAPREVRSEATALVGGLAGIAPPVAVLRHWSHESEEVFEGGEQRILEFGVAVLDEAGAVRAERTYRPGNGLDFFVTARDLTALMGRPVTASVLPEPAAATATGSAPPDLLGALGTALAVGAGVLGTRPR